MKAAAAALAGAVLFFLGVLTGGPGNGGPAAPPVIPLGVPAAGSTGGSPAEGTPPAPPPATSQAPTSPPAPGTGDRTDAASEPPAPAAPEAPTAPDPTPPAGTAEPGADGKPPATTAPRADGDGSGGVEQVDGEVDCLQLDGRERAEKAKGCPPAEPPGKKADGGSGADDNAGRNRRD